MSPRSLIIALLAPFIVSMNGATTRFDALLKNNPFAANEPPPAPPPEPPPQFELRGVLVENGTCWFSLYDIGTKKEMWVQRDEMVASYQVKDFDRTKDMLLLEGQGRRVTLALKQSKILASPPTQTGGPASMFASVSAPNVPFVQPAAVTVAAAMPASESQRLEQVASDIRARREQRLRQAGAQSSTRI